MDERFPAIKACAAILLSTAALLFLLVFSCCSGQNSDDIKQEQMQIRLFPAMIRLSRRRYSQAEHILILSTFRT
ncbi:MAG: hypothetical protein ACLUZ4_01335 [Christensenellaceae bacterium]